MNDNQVTQQEENNTENKLNNEIQKKKVHGPVYWIIVVIGVAFIVAASINIGMKLGNNVESNGSSTSKTSNINSDSNKEQTGETKITDKVKTDYIKKYVSILEQLIPNGQGTSISTDAELHYFLESEIYSFDTLEKKDITEQMATSTMVYITYLNGKKEANVSEITEATKKELGVDTTEFSYAAVDNFIEDYKILFGFNNISTSKVDIKCNNFIYDSKLNGFILYANGCGTVGAVADQKTYIYDITEDDNNAYVYIAYGAFGTTENNKLVAYTDYKMSQKYTGTVTENFEINESNYNDFSKYKYTFTKNSDGTYTFNNFSLLK